MEAQDTDIAFGFPRSLLRPIPELEVAADALDLAAQCCVEHDVDEARRILGHIDGRPLLNYWHHKERPARGKGLDPARGRERPRPLPLSINRAILARDCWVCRYCDVRIVDPEARSALQRLVLPMRVWGRRDQDRHPALLVLSGVADHVVPATHFVTSAEANHPDNLVACCWTCNFGKMSYTLAALGLDDPSHRQPTVHPGWDGLRRLLSL